jgi:hypothetical protein
MEMGLGRIGDANTIFKRKFRWTFEVLNTCKGNIPPYFVKTANRPQLDIDETEINFLHAKTWLPGKGTWNTLSVSYYDTNHQEMLNLWGWLTSVYNFTRPNELYMNSKVSGYSGTGKLVLYDGCGKAMEQWLLYHCWPKTLEFGDLDMSSSEECSIELTLRYTNVKYTSFCPKPVQACQCDPC